MSHHRPRISLASSRLSNSQASDISSPNTSRLNSLGITVSGPAMRAAKNPSSCSTFSRPAALAAFEEASEAVEFGVGEGIVLGEGRHGISGRSRQRFTIPPAIGAVRF